MAHYLHRAFGGDPEVHVLHGPRIAEPKQPEQNSSPACARSTT